MAAWWRRLGAQVTGTWPGLAAGNLFQGEDLAITTDLRDVLVQLLDRLRRNCSWTRPETAAA